MIRTVIAAVLTGACSCCSSAFCIEKTTSTQSSLRLVDANATAETRALFINLRKLGRHKLLFGHQHTTCYGIGWRNDDNRSDVKSVTGSFPAVYGWDMWHKGTDHPAKLIREAYARGGINTISWHMENLVTGRGYLDRKGKANAVPNILPGGSHHEEFKKKLDSFVDFLAELKDEKGRPIPIIFRPWHENNQVRFWWAVRGDGHNYVKLWRFTVEYLRD
ncbi:MAG: beta-mannosidase, partial [Candidatus Hydrogenedentota bacterium]